PQAATGLTWVWEITAPVLLLAMWYRRTSHRPGLRAAFSRVDFRRWFVLIGVAVHLGIFLAMDVGPFSCVMLSYYLCLFRPDEWQRAWQRAGRGRFWPLLSRFSDTPRPSRQVSHLENLINPGCQRG